MPVLKELLVCVAAVLGSAVVWPVQGRTLRKHIAKATTEVLNDAFGDMESPVKSDNAATNDDTVTSHQKIEAAKQITIEWLCDAELGSMRKC